MHKAIHYLSVLIVCYVPYAYSEGVEDLSKETRILLRSEMSAIATGMNNLFAAYYSGDFKEVSRIAKNIEDSFILKKEMTQGQRHEIHTVLPKGFLRRDKQFHYNAGMLAHVAEKGKDELVGFYFSELAKGCIGCHSEYAKDRFGHLVKPKKEVEEHHH